MILVSNPFPSSLIPVGSLDVFSIPFLNVCSLKSLFIACVNGEVMTSLACGKTLSKHFLEMSSFPKNYLKIQK